MRRKYSNNIENKQANSQNSRINVIFLWIQWIILINFAAELRKA